MLHTKYQQRLSDPLEKDAEYITNARITTENDLSWHVDVLR
jgi:hypothetical protein